MGPAEWWRWVFSQGMPRMILRRQARRGDPFARLIASEEGIRDPYPLIEQLRGDHPLVHTPVTWASFDHELVRSVLRDNRFGVQSPQHFTPFAGAGSLVPDAPRLPSPVEPPSMLVIDPPEHTTLRKSVAAAFTPRAIGRLRDRVAGVTAELIDRLPSGGSADLVSAYSAQVPIAIISEMLGFPDADREMFLEWGDRLSPLLDLGIPWRTQRHANRSTRRMNDYLDQHIATLRRTPGEDILSTLVSAGELDDDALKATASLLMGAGFETTVNLISNGVVQLLAHPEQLDSLREDPDLWPNAVEEILRFDPPVQVTGRVPLTALELAGVEFRPGQAITLSLAGANRDPKVFPDPHRFDITRANAKDHLTFSSGIHVCLGASLARMEGAYALRALFDSFPDLSIAGPPRRRELFTLHGYERLPVRLGTRAAAGQASLA